MRFGRRAAVLAAIALAFGLGVWMAPGLTKFRDEFFVGKSYVRCLPDSTVCVGQLLAETHIRMNSGLSLETVICPEAHMGVDLPEALQGGVCRESISSLSFSRDGRWYIVKVAGGRVTQVEDGPQMGWAL